MIEEIKNSQQAIDMESKHGAHNYHPLPAYGQGRLVFFFGM